MRRMPMLLKEVLITAGITLLLAIAFPIIVVLFFTMRFALVIGGSVALLGSVLAYSLSPSVRSWFKTQTEQQFNYNGLRLATNVFFHPSHSWARITDDDVVVGIDDFAQATLGPVEAVELPTIGCQIDQGDRVFSLRRGNRKVEVRAPVSGTVVSCNKKLLEQPQLVNEEPFVDGWAVRLQSENLREERPHLMRGKHARSWFRGEVDWLIGTMLGEENALMPALPDGGALVKDLYLQIDDNAWKQLKESSFDLDGTLHVARR